MTVLTSVSGSKLRDQSETDNNECHGRPGSILPYHTLFCNRVLQNRLNSKMNYFFLQFKLLRFPYQNILMNIIIIIITHFKNISEIMLKYIFFLLLINSILYSSCFQIHSKIKLKKTNEIV